MLASDTMRYLNSPVQLFEVVLGYNLVVYFGMYAEHAFVFNYKFVDSATYIII